MAMFNTFLNKLAFKVSRFDLRIKGFLEKSKIIGINLFVLN
jgi:hypothetical protein